MIKDLLLIHEAPTISPGALGYRDYVKTVHIPRALSVPALVKEMKRFTLNHIDEGIAQGPALYPPINGLDTVVEHVVGGWEGMQRIMADEQYLATVRPCEEFMVQNIMAGQPQFIVVDDEQTIFSADDPGTVRMFDMVHRPETLSRETFLEKLEEDAAWAAAEVRYRRCVAKRVHSIVGQGAAPFGDITDPFDAVIEVWISDAAVLSTLVSEQRERRAAFCDPDRSFTALTAMHRIV